MLALGFSAGIYALPILIAPDSPASGEVQQAVQNAQFSGAFRRDLADSDFLHWGEGQVSIGPDVISFQASWHQGRITNCIYRHSSSKQKPILID